MIISREPSPQQAGVGWESGQWWITARCSEWTVSVDFRNIQALSLTMQSAVSAPVALASPGPADWESAF